jgi:pimeloyl-ACP methyl ester carboxylesterase
MSRTGDHDRIGRFRNERARGRWLAGYDSTIAGWPVTGDALDVPTRFGPTRAYRYGPSDGMPIVLLSGIGGCALGWVYSVGPLSHANPVYAVDPIGGAGRSVQTAPLRDVDDLVAWLIELLDGLDVPAARLVGYSYGGWYALHTARKAPDRVVSLTMVESGGFAPIGVRHYLWGLPAGLALLGPPATRRLAARWLHTPSLLRVEDLSVSVQATYQYRGQLPPMRPFSDEELHAVATPTLVLLGEKSSLHRSSLVKQRVEPLMPNATVEIIPGVGHSLPLDLPDEVNARILRFT